MQRERKQYFYCIVRECKNTSVATPNKVFLTVPKERNRRNQWLQACRRDGISLKTSCYICEDHFNLETDLLNYMKWKIMGGKKYLKPGVVPHIFKWKSEVDVDMMSQTASPDIPHHIQQEGNRIDVGIQTQTHACNKRSKQTQTCSILVNKSCSPFKSETNIVNENIIDRFQKPGISTNEFKDDSSNDEDFEIDSSEDDSEIESNEDVFENKTDDNISRFMINLMKTKSSMYLGIPNDCIYIMQFFKKESNLNDRDIILTLRKIKTDITFPELSDLLGISPSYCSKIFKKTVYILSNILRQMIIWPSKQSIQNQLPLVFRPYYDNVESIIDCFEIEIQKPSNAILQTMTWSQYKKTNTFKYLISSTPDGIINFVSRGFGGRITDSEIVKDSGFLNKLRPESCVMADRGFKSVESLLAQKKCKLVRPPSTKTGETFSKEEAIETKKIASLRIHIERVIRRIREFKMLKPYSCVNVNLIPYLDSIVLIACGLINMQPSLIKK